MDFDTFMASLKDDAPPPGLSPALQALWTEAHGDWDKAHAIVQGSPDSSAARVHAYLHRKEGNRSNARYWYSRAGAEPFEGSLEEEWRETARALVEQS